MVDMKKREFEKVLENLRGIKGRHTELVTVFIPAGYNIQKAIDQLKNEQSTAQNIKSKPVRKNVMAALEKILAHLKEYRKTPENGLAVFCGNVSEKEGISEIQIFVINPHEKIRTKLYQCDQRFVLGPLEEIIEEKEIYGLIILDKSEANIGILKGRKVESLKHMESIVPGKTKKGGWCVHEKTLLPLVNGSSTPIQEIGENGFYAFDFNSYKTIPAKHNHYFKKRSRKALKIVTYAPRIELIATPEHRFFTLNENGVSVKHLADLSVGERLIAAKNVNVKGREVKLKKSSNDFPSKITSDLAQFLGYALGDGNTEANRITLADADEGLLKIYKKLAKNIFGVDGVMRNRETKGYWQLRLHSKELVTFLQEHFPDAVRSHEKGIPPSLSLVKDSVLAAFLRGLFDAEGYVHSGKRIGITMNREMIIRSLQILLLRFGILSSFMPVTGKSFAKKSKYSITIDDRESLERFSSIIGFSGTKKKHAMNNIKKRSPMSRVDQVPIDGRYVRNRVKTLRMNRMDFPEAGSMYLMGKRFMSPSVFERNILQRIEERVEDLGKKQNDLSCFRKLTRIYYKEIASQLGVRTSTIFGNMKNGWNPKPIRKILERERKRMLEEGKKIMEEFRTVLNSDAISVKIGSITPVKASGFFYDMEVNKHENFIANGIIVHNSANRYQRIREGLLEDFLKNVGEAATAEFKDMKNLRGIIVGGPGPIKENFAEDDYLNYEIKKKVLGIVNTSYTGEPGLEEMIERSDEIIAEATAIKEGKLLERFFTNLAKDTGLSVYGEKTIDSVKQGVVDILIITENFLKENEEKAKLLIRNAEDMGTKVEIVSHETPRGRQLKELGGLCGILRYKV